MFHIFFSQTRSQWKTDLLLPRWASPNCRLVFPIFLPKGQREHISHICSRPRPPSHPPRRLAFHTLHFHCPSFTHPMHIFLSTKKQNHSGVYVTWSISSRGFFKFLLFLLITPPVGVKKPTRLVSAWRRNFFQLLAYLKVWKCNCVKKMKIMESLRFFPPVGWIANKEKILTRISRCRIQFSNRRGRMLKIVMVSRRFFSLVGWIANKSKSSRVYEGTAYSFLNYVVAC